MEARSNTDVQLVRHCCTYVVLAAATTAAVKSLMKSCMPTHGLKKTF